MDDTSEFRLDRATSTARVRTARALWEATGDDEYVSEVAAVLESLGERDDRVAAAEALRELPITPRSLAALHRGMSDPDPLVRHRSGESLLGLAGQPPDLTADGRSAQVADDDPAAWRAVADEVLGAFGTRSAGVYGDRASFAVELGPADYVAPHHRAAGVFLAGVRLAGPERPHVPSLRNVGVYTTYPDRVPDYPNLRATLEQLGFGGLPEPIALDEVATAATLDAVAAALDFDFDVSRWCVTEILVGDRSRIALEIGPADPGGDRLRVCTLWLDGAIATPFDNMAYVPQFVHSLRLDAARYRAGRSPDFAYWGPTTDDLDAELHSDGTLRYRLRSRIEQVGDREGVVRLSIEEIVDVLEEAADVLSRDG
ncbi:hypothetical protein ACIBCH_35010 [Amycolatopsis thailandensis]|uniref:hypothetical protein n=1 Tax=Amycolatopsis thailandensis TaxID=589330 RepID=UPI0037BA0F89